MSVNAGFAPWMQPKTAWPPCAQCGDPNGRIKKDKRQRVTPTRLGGAAFGIEGQICLTCYERLVGQQRSQRARERRSAPIILTPVQELAAAVLAFEAVRASGDKTEKKRRYWRMVGLAREHRAQAGG